MYTDTSSHDVETSRMHAHCVLRTRGHGRKPKASYLHKTFSRKVKAVHRTPTKDLQKLVNVFIFVSSASHAKVVMWCLIHSKCGRATQKQNWENNLISWQTGDSYQDTGSRVHWFNIFVLQQGSFWRKLTGKFAHLRPIYLTNVRDIRRRWANL